MSTSEQDTQYREVYGAISAVAAHCDGAVTLDGQGFNGQDTHFGRRVASVPYESWTDDVKAEAARVILTYKEQVLRYTGLDVSSLDVVRQAQGRTNYKARDDARAYERRAQGAEKLALRRIDLVDGKLGIFYDKKDPDFGALLSACQQLPGRQFDWNLKCNVVPPSDAVEAFILTWDFPTSKEALAALRSRPERFDVTLHESGLKCIIERPYNASEVSSIQKLPGRAYVGGDINQVDCGPKVLDLAEHFGWRVHPDAQVACQKAAEALRAQHSKDLVAGDRATLMIHLSRLRRPEDVPDVVIQMLQEQS